MLEIILKAIGYLILTGATLFIALAIHCAIGEHKEELVRDHGPDGWKFALAGDIFVFLLIIAGWIWILNR